MLRALRDYGEGYERMTRPLTPSPQRAILRTVNIVPGNTNADPFKIDPRTLGGS